MVWFINYGGKKGPRYTSVKKNQNNNNNKTTKNPNKTYSYLQYKFSAVCLYA